MRVGRGGGQQGRRRGVEGDEGGVGSEGGEGKTFCRDWQPWPCFRELSWVGWWILFGRVDGESWRGWRGSCLMVTGDWCGLFHVLYHWKGARFEGGIGIFDHYCINVRVCGVLVGWNRAKCHE